MGKFWTAVALLVLALRPATAAPLPPMLEEIEPGDEMIWEGEEGTEEPFDPGEETMVDDFVADDMIYDPPTDEVWMVEDFLYTDLDLPPFDEMFPPLSDGEEVLYYSTAAGPGSEPAMSHNPEPSSLVLGGLGCLGLLGQAWRKWRGRRRT